MNHEGGYFGPLMRISLPLMKNILTPLAKSVMIPLGLTAVTSAQLFKRKFMDRIISNKEMKDIMEIVQYLEEPGLLNEGFSKTIESEVKEQKG